MNEDPKEGWGEAIPFPRLPHLDRLETESVNIQCIESSDFVVGKQTNFNGPVTIISCADILKQRMNMKEVKELVIRDDVLSPSAAMKIQNLAEKKEGPKEPLEEREKRPPEGIAKLANLPKVPVFICAGVLLAFAVGVTVFFSTGLTEEHACFPLSKDVCLYPRYSEKSPETLEPLGPPVPFVIIFQTYAGFCYDVEECMKMREQYLSAGAGKASCGLLVGGEGNAYEAFGWGCDDSSVSPTDTRALRICFMGTFNDEDEYPTYPQVIATKTLISFGVDNGFVSKDYILTASNATSPEYFLASIYKIIKKWPNFSEKPFPRQ